MKVIANYCNIQILSDELTTQEAENYCKYAVNEREKVEAYWGASWKELIRIHVDSSYKVSKALFPMYQGDRGFMEMPLTSVKRNSGPLLHEIVHIYAPNDNRFLAEGLAVYLQYKFGGNPVIYVLDKNLDDLAREKISLIDSVQLLNKVRSPASFGRDRNDVEGRRAAYIVGGSFVGFLIEKYGLSQFKDVYKNEDYTKIDGKSLDILEGEWLESLKIS